MAIEGSIPRLLLIEDDDVNRRLMVTKLGAWGYEVIEAVSGGEALVQFKTRSFTAILTDLEMPGLDGFGVARQIRAMEARRGADAVPIIAVTAHAVGTYRDQCIRVGMTGYVTKPLNWATLRAVLRGVCDEAGIPRVTSTQELARVDVVACNQPPSMDAVWVDEDVAPLVPGFLDSRKRDVVTMRGQLQISDASGLERVGHTLKGVGGSFGFARVTELGAEIERAAGRRDFVACMRAVEALGTYLHAVSVGVIERRIQTSA